jgi:hypothetical protein
MAKRRSMKRMKGGDKMSPFATFTEQTVNTDAPPPPTVPQGPLGGRRRRRTMRGGNPGGEYVVPPMPTSPPTGPFTPLYLTQGGKRRRSRKSKRAGGPGDTPNTSSKPSSTGISSSMPLKPKAQKPVPNFGSLIAKSGPYRPPPPFVRPNDPRSGFDIAMDRGGKTRRRHRRR